ncbi:hypothetical protein FB381_2154 [Nocardioides albertanoniae]|uniref:Uncharacterized protein n=2 Tax=Nocardioides albertanoniae TaxID=1175486 RepID=A0A543A6N5_9ACTN|nr:hypothetical protein FB381_2154 [Nocardioides albertanoniae]
MALGAPASAGPGEPPNPYAGPDGTAGMHGDSAASDTTAWAGPGAEARPGWPVTLPAVCPTILAGRDGMVQALCTEYADRAPSLYLIDPHTWLPVARRHLKAGDLLGGVYAYIDHRDRLVTVDGSGSIRWLDHERTALGWRITVDQEQPVDLPEGDAVTTLGPGYDGHIWFATSQGRAGYAVAGGETRFVTLGDGSEKVANSIATSTRGTAVTSDHATYLLRSTATGVDVVWRRAYDRGPARKPGQLSWGSGSTPTFFGPRSGSDYVAITDNARPRERLLVYRADDGREVCRLPILGPESSGTENSPVAWGRSVYLASTYGYPYPAQATEHADPADPEKADFVGGMTRIDVSPDGCRTRWTNDTASAAVPRLSREENVLYTVKRSAGGWRWQLARIDPETGRELSLTHLGLGPLADTLQMVGTILPDGTLLQGNIAGLRVVRPRG